MQEISIAILYCWCCSADVLFYAPKVLSEFNQCFHFQGNVLILTTFSTFQKKFSGHRKFQENLRKFEACRMKIRNFSQKRLQIASCSFYSLTQKQKPFYETERGILNVFDYLSTAIKAICNPVLNWCNLGIQ